MTDRRQTDDRRQMDKTNCLTPLYTCMRGVINEMVRVGPATRSAVATWWI